MKQSDIYIQTKTKLKEEIKRNVYTKSVAKVHLSYSLLKFVQIEAYGASATPYQA